MANSEELTVMQ